MSSTPAQHGRGERRVLFHFHLEIELIIHSQPLRIRIFCGDIISHYICNLNYVETVAPSVLWCIDTADFARQLAVDPSFTPVMMRVLGRLLRNAVTLIDDLAFREVPARLARFLLGLVDRRGQPHPQGWLIPLELGTEDIASLLGSTRQTVSLLLNQWVRDGILARPGRRQLLVLSRQALADLSAS